MDSIDKKFSIDEAVKIISEEASKKFVEAIDVAVNLGIDPVKTDQAVRGATNLPHGNIKLRRNTTTGTDPDCRFSCRRQQRERDVSPRIDATR